MRTWLHFPSAAGLFLATFAWGASFFLVKAATAQVGVWPFLAYRFLFAMALMAICFPGKLRNARLPMVRRAAVLGALLFGAIWTQTQGLQFTTATRSGFLTALYVPLTPLLGWIIFRKPLHVRQLGIAFLAMAGLYLLTNRGPLSNGILEYWKGVNPGDIWTLLTALVCAVHIVVMEKYSREEADSIALGMWQFIWCLLFIAAAVVHEMWEHPGSQWNVLAWPRFSVFSVIFNAVLCTAFGFIMQIVAQKSIGALKAALIFALEAPFASGFAFAFLGELMTFRELAGAAIVFLTSIIPEAWLKKPER